MDGMWHLNAPQWTDFESSPQIPDDDYFEREHQELEPQSIINKTVVPAVAATEIISGENDSELKNNPLGVSGKDDNSLINEIEIAKMTPVKVISPRSRNKKYCKGRETTYDNVLSEAMASLQLSVKKKSRRSQVVRNAVKNLVATPTNADKTVAAKFLNLHNGPRSTPSNPIPMWIRKTRPSEDDLKEKEKEKIETLSEDQVASEKQDNLVPQDAQEPEDQEIGKNESNTDPEKPDDVNTVPDNEDLDVDEQPNASKDSDKSKEEADAFVLEDTIAPIASFIPGHSKSEISQISDFFNKGQRAKFSTCQLRRRSLTQYRRRSNKYISLAEAISKFHNKTPVRFRSMSTKQPKPGPVQKVRQSSVSATVPISPALRCKTRTRPAALSHEERERLEIEEIRKNSVRENMARSSSVKSLTQNTSSKLNAKKTPATTRSEACSSQSIDKKVPAAKVNRETRIKVTVPSVVSTSDGIAIKDAEISYFGVPDITTAKPTATKIIPFSFEMRNKELQKKKEKKIKELMTEEEKKTKIPFHARPVPTFKKPMLAVPKESGAQKPGTKPCPFSFEERDKNLMRKKENLIKNVLEEDKKARIFQAKPIPEFKPVLVRGRSKENINAGNKPPNAPPLQKNRISMLPVSKTGSRNFLHVKTSDSNEENQNPMPTLERSKSVEVKSNSQQKIGTRVLAQFHLNTDKRAKERKEFDERIKQKEQEIELLRKEAEMEKLKRDETQIAEIRRMAETKARPMPAYKEPAVIHSDKPLTVPQSPGWAWKPNR